MIESFNNESCQRQSCMAQSCLRGAIELVNLDKTLSEELANVALRHATDLHHLIESNSTYFLISRSEKSKEIYAKLLSILGSVDSWRDQNNQSGISDNQVYEEFLTRVFSLIDKASNYISKLFKIIKYEFFGKKNPQRCDNSLEDDYPLSNLNAMPIEVFYKRTKPTLPPSDPAV